MGDKRQFIVLLLLSVLLAGCASQQPLTDPEGDPWEGFNRKMFTFNAAMDKVIIKPVARAYDAVLPEPVKDGVGNFLTNLAYPNTIINLMLQGKWDESAHGLGRFLVNTTIGIGGIFDVATKAGIPLYQEDFGQTLAVWGYEDSRYLVLPFFGPTSVRDSVGRTTGRWTNPIPYLAIEENIWSPTILEIIHGRYQLLPLSGAIEDAVDPYLLMRDFWRQQRAFDIYDGNPPEVDYDDYLE